MYVGPNLTKSVTDKMRERRLAHDQEALEKSIHLRRAPSGGLEAYRGGQFIPTVLWEREREKARIALPVLLDAFGQRLQFLREVYTQNAALLSENMTKVPVVSLYRIETEMKAVVGDAYARAFLLGKKFAGNLTSATEAETTAVQGVRKDELRYLERFASDMQAHAGKMDYERRMDYYRAAGRELFWLGFVLGNMKTGRFIIWNLGPTEHCESCRKLAGRYPVMEFVQKVVEGGMLPQSGRLACLGYHCQCSLSEEFA